MKSSSLNIWCNMGLPKSALDLLKQETASLNLLFPANLQASNLVAASADPQVHSADIVFGQPDPAAVLEKNRLGWIQISSAGYERYDTPEFRAAVKSRGVIVTNSSSVYDEPCAEHVLAMMLALSRRLNEAQTRQQSDHGWPALDIRTRCHLLLGQSVLLLGFGAIGRRLVELLAPFKVRMSAVRRSPDGSEPVPTFGVGEIGRLLAEADHVVNVLPGGRETAGFMSRQRFEQMRPTALYYNVGRGSTDDQAGLADALRAGRIGGAYLDVMVPEPLPAEHSLWTLPNCWITPHSAGGHEDEHIRLVRHFAANLRRFERGEALRDRIM
ncbi:MAG: D-2-hydroxyacid dehydrogenase [Tepidisphaeraceae bacterium]|jgi:phosphoglycerate dehydrogenase-like enzyme